MTLSEVKDKRISTSQTKAMSKRTTGFVTPPSAPPPDAQKERLEVEQVCTEDSNRVDHVRLPTSPVFYEACL